LIDPQQKLMVIVLLHFKYMKITQFPAMILAAGRGERMRPLSDVCPKPLLTVRGKPLIQWILEALLIAGVRNVTINTAWLESQITDYFNSEYLNYITQLYNIQKNIKIQFSNEGYDFGNALETAGGIVRALPFIKLGINTDPENDIFWVVAGDIYIPDFSFLIKGAENFINNKLLAHLWLVPNPSHHLQGDFGISQEGLAVDGPGKGGIRYTFSTIALYRYELFTSPWCDIPFGNPKGVIAPLAPLLRRAMAAGRVSAQLYTGTWMDVGTPERLAQLNIDSI
jgi:MurNAc alpha-1-phosphate uridylyltransferase